MRKACASCGQDFDAKRAAAKYCGERCRKRGQRGGKSEPKVAPVPEPSADDVDDGAAVSPFEGLNAKATRLDLENAGRLDTALGVAALTIAIRLDLAMVSADTGSSFAALVKEHRAALVEAVKDAETEADPLDEIRAGAALKLVQGGRSGGHGRTRARQPS